MSATTESTIRTVKSTTTLAEEIDSQTSRARTSTNFGGSLIFFIDDIITFFHPKNQNRASAFKKSLIESFDVKDLGELKWFLGVLSRLH